MLHADRPTLSDIPAPNRPAPRYCPERDLPPYRYVPGLHPHPVRDPAGHSYEPAPRRHRHPAWEPRDWPHLSEWLAGVDRFNAFYFWEAHEAWEAPWSVAPRATPPHRMLQGLIQIAAALLKVHLGSLAGAAVLSTEGLDRLRSAAAVEPELLGLDLPATVADFHHYFRPLDRRTLPPLDASVPLLLLAARADA